ncbi:hypothetical protein ABK040_002058 [Willaertia magna]
MPKRTKNNEVVDKDSTKQKRRKRFIKLKTIIQNNSKQNPKFQNTIKNTLTLLIKQIIKVNDSKEITQKINKENKINLLRKIRKQFLRRCNHFENKLLKELTKDSTKETITINTDEKPKELTVIMFKVEIGRNIYLYRWEFKEKITKNVFDGKLNNTCHVIAKIEERISLEGNIKKTLTFGKSEDVYFSLKGQVLTEIEFNNSADVLNLMVDLLIDLHNLHAQRVIHNDIKPQNIVKFNNMFKFIDFGISKEYSRYDKQNEQCFGMENKVLTSKSGTKGYFPPEKLENGNGEITPKSDIYSLGLVITSKVLPPSLNCENSNEVIDAITKWQPNDEINKAIKVVLLGMVKVEKVERFSISECIKILAPHHKLIDQRIKIYENFDAKEYLPVSEVCGDVERILTY